MKAFVMKPRHSAPISIRWRTMTILLLVGASMVTFAHAAPGDLDTSFGTSGKVITSPDIRGDRANDVVIQSDGKIVVIGKRQVTDFNSDFLIIRYASDGSLDTSFGIGGKTSTDFDQGEDAAYGVALQSNGKIVSAGATTFNQLSSDFALVRYNSDGTLDTDFNGDGRLVLDFNDVEDIVYAVALDKNGKIVVAGVTRSGTTVSDFALARFNTNGDLDDTFGTNGRLTLDFNFRQDTAYAMVVDPFGNIFAAGVTGTDLDADFALAKFNRSGQLDTTFGTQGLVTTDLGAREDIAFAMTLDNDGKILLAGVTRSDAFGSDVAIVRYNAGGGLDTTFGDEGVVLTDLGNRIDEALDITVQSDDKIIVAGRTQIGTLGDDMALIRYENNGERDVGFGDNGIVITSFTINTDIATSVALQSDGKIVTAGVSAENVLNSAAVALARFLTAEDKDTDVPPDTDDTNVKGTCFISSAAGGILD